MMCPDFPRNGQCPRTNWKTLLTVLHQESSHHIHSKSDSGSNKPKALLLYFKIVHPNGLSQSWQTDLYILGDEIIMILFSYITFHVAHSCHAFLTPRPVSILQESNKITQLLPVIMEQMHISTRAFRGFNSPFCVAVFSFQV